MLLHVLTETVALAHPLIPFETEEIYSYIPGTEGLLAARVSAAQAPPMDDAAESTVQRAITAVQALRRWRALEKVEAGATLPARLTADGYDETSEHVARLARITLNGATEDAVATVPVPGGVVEILASPEVDPGASARRIEAERETLRAEIDRAERKLANQGFTAKAPPAVVQAERDKLTRLREELDAL